MRPRAGSESVTEVPPADRARDTQTDEIVALKKVRMDKEKDGERGRGAGPREPVGGCGRQGSRGTGPSVPGARRLRERPRGAPRALGFGSPSPVQFLRVAAAPPSVSAHPRHGPSPLESWPVASVCPMPPLLTTPHLPGGLRAQSSACSRLAR